MPKLILQTLLRSIEARESVALLSVTEGDGAYTESVGKHLILWLDEKRSPVGKIDLGSQTERVLAEARQALNERRHRHIHIQGPDGSARIFVEVQAKPPHLIIVGAGHIALPLASIAKLNDFEVTVLDDRPQYAHSSRFPTADRVIAGPFRAELNNLRPGDADGLKQPFDNHTYLVLVTRGHQYDVESLLEVLDDPVAYIGMIGSQRRIRAVFDLLETEQNIPRHKFDRIYAPIGIDIGARTPAEIAVCIMAEIINVLRKGPAVGMSETIRQERKARQERVRNRET
ncbi:XdhC family protein [Chloroflexi bacterium TSY]|nr:XdhC family protein [Chloroflexi bacterium TSY]